MLFRINRKLTPAETTRQSLVTSKTQLLGMMAKAQAMLVNIQAGLLHAEVESAPYGLFQSEDEAKAQCHLLHSRRAQAVQSLRVLLLQASGAAKPLVCGEDRSESDGGGGQEGAAEPEPAAIPGALSTRSGWATHLYKHAKMLTKAYEPMTKPKKKDNEMIKRLPEQLAGQ